MRDSNRNLIILLWAVIAVLCVGSAVGGFLLVHHTSSLEQANTELGGDNASLKRQVEQARAALAATPSPTATPDATPQPTATPVPTATPKLK